MALYRDILLVDDDPLVLMNYLDIFEEAGFNAIGADSLAQAWRELSGRNFDLVVSDHDLGDGKGTVLIQRLQESGRDIPVIYLSAAIPSVLEEVGRLPLVKKVLTKPVSPEVLLEAVKAFIPAKEELHRDSYPQAIGREERDLLLNLFNSIEP